MKKDLPKRIEALSPERRELLKTLIAKQQKEQGTATEQGASQPLGDSIDTIRSSQFANYLHAPSDQKKKHMRRLYNTVSDQLNASPFGAHSFFLNFGYVANDSPQYAQVILPEHCLNQHCIKLVLEMIADCPVGPDNKVLDVGCGRGGTIFVLSEYFSPGRLTGVDLSSSAVAFCHRTHTYPRTCFLEGDAEKLPFADSSFDIVTNVESSHSYPNISLFYAEVARVLRRGGHFLYTDLFPTESLNEAMALLQNKGFSIERETDITSNVLLSCDQIGQTHARTFSDNNDPGFMDNFLGVPGSRIYNDMVHGNTTYQIFKLKKVQ